MHNTHHRSQVLVDKERELPSLTSGLIVLTKLQNYKITKKENNITQVD